MHIGPFPAGCLGALISLARRKPLVITSHGAGIDNFDRQPWFIQYCVRAVLERANAVIAVGQQHRRNLMHIAPLLEEKVFTIPMGVWRDMNVLDRMAARKHLSLSLEQAIVIFIGNLEMIKGPDILLQAVQQIPFEKRNFQLLLGGQGMARVELETYAKMHGINEMTTFLGSIPPRDVSKWLAAADICVVPSRSESFGLVALEAMQSGTPVIASAVGGLAENIKHKHNGLLFTCGNYLELANQLEALLDDHDFRRQIAVAGRQVVDRYNMTVQAQRVFDLYNTIRKPIASDQGMAMIKGERT